MAAGDRKIKITSVRFMRANPVTYEANWELWIENKVGVDVLVTGSYTAGSFGTATAWRAMTGLQMETAVTAAVTAAVETPARDSVS